MEAKPVPYRLRARLMDWHQGRRDGRAGIPDRETSVGRVTTPHREALIRLALEVFEHERLRYERARGDAPERIAAVTARLDQLRAHKADAEQHLAEVSAQLSGEERTWRRIGDLRRDERVVVQRRKTEQKRRIAAARLTLDSIKAEIGRAEAEKAAATKADRRKLTAASVRVFRFHEHTHRRLNSYLRTLIRHHFDGEWARAYLTVDPFLPGWITREVIPEPAPPKVPLPRPDVEDEAVSEEPPVIIPLRPIGETKFGSDEPPPYNIDVPGTAPQHFVLVREGTDRLRLRDFGWGHGPYRDGVPVKSDLLKPEDHFDFADHRYQVLDGCAKLRRTPLHPVVLIVADLCARAQKRSIGKRQPKRLLTKMSFVQEKSTVLAVVGRSGSGKSSLLNVLIGDVMATDGHAYFDELDMRGRPAQLSDRLGFVPQNIDLHTSLTIQQLLDYSFQLRYPGPANRGEGRIREVCDRLELGGQLDQLVSTLSGGELRRVSIATELLSKPDLLILDEPTSGLDPGMDRKIMVQLRRYANDGKTVLVTTHATEHLKGTVDNVLVVADGGRPIYFGDPRLLRKELDVDSYARLMDNLTPSGKDQPSPWSVKRAEDYQRTAAVQRAKGYAKRFTPSTAADTRSVERVRRRSARKFRRQLRTLINRQITLLRVRGRNSTQPSARATAVALLPFIIAGVGAALAAWITPGGGLGPHPGRSGSIAIGVLTTLAVLSGQALTYGDLVADFPVIRREHRVGIGLTAVMLSKWLVFAAVAALQAALVTGVFALIRWPGPAYSNLLPPLIELWVDLAALTVAAMSLGLLISAVARRLEQAVALVTLTSIAQIALNGVTAPVPHYLSWTAAVLPDRWGLSAVASSADLERITFPASGSDVLWAHMVPHWLLDLGMTGLLAACYTLLAGYALRRRLRPTPAPRGWTVVRSGAR